MVSHDRYVSQLKYYAVSGPAVAMCLAEHERQVKRIKDMTRWVRKNLPGVPKKRFMINYTKEGLHAVEHHGPVPVNFKQYGDGMIAPRRSTKKGKEVAELWKGFGSEDLTEVVDYLDVPRREFNKENRTWSPTFTILGDRVFLITLMDYKHPELRPMKRWEYERFEDEHQQINKSKKKRQRSGS